MKIKSEDIPRRIWEVVKDSIGKYNLPDGTSIPAFWYQDKKIPHEFVPEGLEVVVAVHNPGYDNNVVMGGLAYSRVTYSVAVIPHGDTPLDDALVQDIVSLLPNATVSRLNALDEYDIPRQYLIQPSYSVLL